MQILPQKNWNTILSIVALLFICSLVAACDSGTAPTQQGPVATNGAKGCTKVGILLPNAVSSLRWGTKDYPLLVKALTAAIPGVHIDYNDDHDSSDIQLSEAETDLANGDCLLVVAPHDSVAAAAIVEKAKAQNVPVIAYDRMIESKDLNFYVSFNGIEVGRLQGKYIAQHYQQYLRGYNTSANMMVISGSQTDTNALLFSQGFHQAIDPLLADGTLKTVYEQFTPDWNSNTAQAEAEAALADQQSNIQIAYVANDGMAGGVMTVLKALHLAGKVLVTGQDATADGINAILAGAQSMTVYKPIAQEALSTGQLAKALYQGVDPNTLTHGATATTFDGASIPAILDTPIAVDSGNIASTVIADGFVTKSQVCAGFPAGTDGVC